MAFLKNITITPYLHPSGPDAKLEEEIEEQVHRIRVEEDRRDEAPDLAARD